MALTAALLIAGCGSSSRPSDPTSGFHASSATTATTGTTRQPAARPSTHLLRLITEPDQGIGAVYSFLASPQHTLDMTMYELVDASAEGALAADAARGVTVRVILDHNEEGAANTPAFDYLAAHRVHVVWARTAYEATHEKSVVIDAGQADAEALIMTLNLTSRYYATTRDFAVIDTDRSDVSAIESAFSSDYAGRPIVAPTGADLLWSPGSQTALISLIDSARTSLDVENEEMADAAVTAALADAAGRGVSVDVTMTADSEWEQAVAQLTAAGVRVRLYPDTESALYIHAKAIVSDGRTAFVGSENFSAASLDYNRELGLITTDPTVVSGVARVLADDHAGAALAPALSVPTVPSARPASCYPLSNEGTCYEQAEYCRADDHGSHGVAGDGETITCRSIDGGWKWESP